MNATVGEEGFAYCVGSDQVQPEKFRVALLAVVLASATVTEYLRPEVIVVRFNEPESLEESHSPRHGPYRHRLSSPSIFDCCVDHLLTISSSVKVWSDDEVLNEQSIAVPLELRRSFESPVLSSDGEYGEGGSRHPFGPRQTSFLAESLDLSILPLADIDGPVNP